MTSAGVHTTLVNFTETSGANFGGHPQGSLVEGSDRSFYGMTAGGGTGNVGTVFRMTSAGVLTTLVNFTGTSGANPGKWPAGSLVQGSDGSFYGMTAQGGTGNIGTVFKLASPPVTATGAEGTAVTQSGIFSDANGPFTVRLTASVGTVFPNYGAGTWIWFHTPADGPDGPATVTITATDNGSPALVATTTVTLNVANVPPAIALSGDSTVNVGAAYTLNFGTITDPGTDTVTAYSINWGDGITEPFSGNPTGLSRTHTYSTWGSRPITVSLTDEDGAHAASGTKTITVNRPPTFSGYTVTTPKNTAATISRAALHALAADPDGGILAISPVSAGSAQGGTVSMDASSVTYTPPAGFTGLDIFTLTITDGQGGSTTGTVTVSVTSGSGPAGTQTQITLLPGGQVAMLFHGIPWQIYRIQRSQDLAAWTTLKTQAAAPDGTLPATDTSPPAGKAYYRTAIP